MNRTFIVRTKCFDCGKEVMVNVNVKDYVAWKRGALIQEAMPYLTADEREILISQICGECYDRRCI